MEGMIARTHRSLHWTDLKVIQRRRVYVSKMGGGGEDGCSRRNIYILSEHQWVRRRREEGDTSGGKEGGGTRGGLLLFFLCDFLHKGGVGEPVGPDPPTGQGAIGGIYSSISFLCNDTVVLESRWDLTHPPARVLSVGYIL